MGQEEVYAWFLQHKGKWHKPTTVMKQLRARPSSILRALRQLSKFAELERWENPQCMKDIKYRLKQ